jgi:hypothetical protein
VVLQTDSRKQHADQDHIEAFKFELYSCGLKGGLAPRSIQMTTASLIRRLTAVAWLSVGISVVCLSVGISSANAQASRTWVSGVGDDANPCSRTAPCKTFAGAISKTAPGGEIDALDPGGFGAVTITKAITIDGGGGQVASVLVSGTNGIVVQAGPNDVVTLRNIQINGIGTGINGVRFLSGKAISHSALPHFRLHQ